MAEETKAPEVVVPEAETPLTAEKEVATTPEKEVEKPEVEAADAEKIAEEVSFKEETNVVSELPESQRKALDELKKLIQEACAKREFSSSPPPPPSPKKEEKVVEEKKTEEEEQTPLEKKEEEVAPPPVDTADVAETATSAVSVEETPKVEEATPVTEEAPKVEEPVPVTEEVKKEEEEEKTVEAIKETIIETTSETPADEQPPQPPPKEVVVEEEAVEPEEVTIWGIPLLADERSDVILLKFLRARDFKVKEAFTMIRNAVRWRKEFGVNELLEEDLGNDYAKVLFTHGHDKEGRVVCYNVFGEFQNKELYHNTFSDAEKRNRFLKWLIQFLEKIIRDLDFSPKGVNSIVLVNDLKNSPGYGKRDVSKIIDRFLVILQDNYPEFVAKQLCINTSWWYVAYYWIYLTVFTPRSKSKFVFASPSKTPETLFKYIAPEHVPVQYGGHSKIGENEFTSADAVTEVIVKPGTKHPIEFAFSEATELVWELRVIGWDVNYGAEFLPAKEGGYTLNISKPKKVVPTEDPVISDTFKVTEAGKVVITIDNQSSKKKKLLYRSKVKASSAE
ncbi:hypothetical protein RND81_03G227900 [Saponaria officinalis]|uniref:Patellin-3 n=1 Tax=Saponaria officinalis TaxID=3572 RepID=A0AAW1M8K9_SAPOF